jgi:LPXTG-motif cell wall-anchored protein
VENEKLAYYVKETGINSDRFIKVDVFSNGNTDKPDISQEIYDDSAVVASSIAVIEKRPSLTFVNNPPPQAKVWLQKNVTRSGNAEIDKNYAKQDFAFQLVIDDPSDIDTDPGQRKVLDPVPADKFSGPYPEFLLVKTDASGNPLTNADGSYQTLTVHPTLALNGDKDNIVENAFTLKAGERVMLIYNGDRRRAYKYLHYTFREVGLKATSNSHAVGTEDVKIAEIKTGETTTWVSNPHWTYAVNGNQPTAVETDRLDGCVTYRLEFTNAPNPKPIPHETPELPSAGGKSYGPWLVLGLALMAGSGTWLIRRRRLGGK